VLDEQIWEGGGIMPIDLTANTIAHYKCNDNAATTNVIDSVGGGDGTASRNTSLLTTASGKIGRAFVFDGEYDFIDTGRTFQAMLNGEFSFNLWLKVPALGAGPSFIFDQMGAGINKCHLWHLSNGDLEFKYVAGVGGTVTAVGAIPASSNFKMITVTVEQFDPNNIVVWFYVNGVAVQSVGFRAILADYTAGAVTATICAFGTSSTVDNFMIFNKVLSTDEIAFLYNGGSGTEALLEYTVTSSAGAGGSISPDGAHTMPAGDDHTFTATPLAGYSINEWTLDGDVVAVGATSFTINNVAADHTISVTFTDIDTTSTNIDQAIYAALTAPASAVMAALGSGKVYLHNVPQSIDLPAITYQRIATEFHHTAIEIINLRRSTYQFTCWNHTMAGAILLAEALETTLGLLKGISGTLKVDFCNPIDEGDMTSDTINDELKRKGRRVDYEIIYKQN
jgi:hypothetical protein